MDVTCSSPGDLVIVSVNMTLYNVMAGADNTDTVITLVLAMS